VDALAWQRGGSRRLAVGEGANAMSRSTGGLVMMLSGLTLLAVSVAGMQLRDEPASFAPGVVGIVFIAVAARRLRGQ
jgi:hypothetical protein